MPALYTLDNVDPRAVDMLAWYNVVGALGCVLWILAYAFAIRKGFQDKAPGFPLVAVSLNFAWELLASLVFPNPAPLWHFFDRAWCVVDVVIVYQLLRYGPALQKVPEVKRHHHALAVITFVLGFIGQYTFVDTFRDRLGLIVAFGINLVMSVAFVAMFLARREHGRGISVGAAWCKMLGTLGTSIQCHYVARYLDPELPNLHFMTFLCASIFAVDAFYVALVVKEARRAAHDAAPATVRSEVDVLGGLPLAS
jgi:hypothetical protein